MKRPLTFVDGVCVGLGAATLLALLWLVIQTGAYENMYKNFGNASLPTLTKLVLGARWKLGAPAFVIALGIVAVVTRARLAIVATPIVTVVLIAVTYQGLFAPLHELAGNISY